MHKIHTERFYVYLINIFFLLKSIKLNKNPQKIIFTSDFLYIKNISKLKISICYYLIISIFFF